MLTSTEIKNYLEKYIISGGNVYLRENNKQVIDEETILKVKSARLIYNEARAKYRSDIQQFGKQVYGDFQKYITNMMERLSVNGEVNTYGTNKLINTLLTSNGHYEEYMLGDNLAESKFSMLSGIKQEYGLAYLKLKFMEKGLNIDNLTIKQDLTELQHNGISKVIIDFQVKKYEKKDTFTTQQSEIQTQSKVQQDDSIKSFSHPKADLLNELEKQKKEALAKNDQVAYNFAQSNIERIIKENPVEVSPKQWDSMGYEERKRFILIKMKESKVLNDKGSFNFWNSNLKQIEERKKELPNENVQSIETNKYTSTQSQQSENQSLNRNNNSQQIVENTTSLYGKMINALKKSRTNNLTKEEKKQIVGEIYYYEMYLVESIKDQKAVGEIMRNAVQDFSNTQSEQTILNSLFSDLGERLKVISPKQKAEQHNSNDINNGDFLVSINNMRQEMNKLSTEYKQMWSDGMIDDQELEYLISRMQVLYRNAMSLKGNNLSAKEYQIVNEIVASISKEQNKMTALRDGIERSVHHFGR